MAESQLVAVWGSTGSGKTLTAVKIARELAERKKDVLLILCDDETPPLPLLIQHPSQDTLSLGHLLALPAMTQMDVLHHCVLFNKNDRISALGYLLGENSGSNPDYSMNRARELFSLAKSLADVVLVDCSHHLMDNVLTAAALESADHVLKVVNADIKSAVYLKSQAVLLRDERFRCDRHINLINAVLPNQNTAPIEAEVGGVSFALPYLPELREQYDSRSLLDTVFGKEARKYNAVIQDLVKKVFTDAQ